MGSRPGTGRAHTRRFPGSLVNPGRRIEFHSKLDLGIRQIMEHRVNRLTSGAGYLFHGSPGGQGPVLGENNLPVAEYQQDGCFARHDLAVSRKACPLHLADQGMEAQTSLQFPERAPGKLHQ